VSTFKTGISEILWMQRWQMGLEGIGTGQGRRFQIPREKLSILANRPTLLLFDYVQRLRDLSKGVLKIMRSGGRQFGTRLPP
jgi:hypothetical protein